MSTLDRLRGIVLGARPAAVPVVSPELERSESDGFSHRLPGPAMAEAVALRTSRAASLLGGIVVETAEGAVIVVDREYRANDRHGHRRIGDVIDTINEEQDALATLARAWSTVAPGASAASAMVDRPRVVLPSPLLFLDLETTGLFTGAGTQAFLVGCAAIDGDSIRVRQFLMPGFEHERAVLAELTAWAAEHGALVTYNGKTFDVPLIETRFLFHRLPFPLAETPHLDMLHAARRLWRSRPITAGPDPDESSCSLSVLEKHLAGLHRVGDVPGFEIPSRYFQFVRDGDARPLEAVLEHNRLDLISLATVMARALTLVSRGPLESANPHECFGLARLYERAAALEHAEGALLRSIDLAKRIGTEPEVHGDALRRLAWIRRRSGRVHEAADTWRELASLPRCAAALRREAKEALAIYHEHRSRDLGTARSLVLDVLNDDPMGRRKTEAEHRLQRLERKIAVRDQGGLVAALDETLQTGP
ncbi:MAG: ribonuclease H-like domain-containing protein [Acidobacteriota bacterium]|nr:ribonuclease H-like domain-containing protein [Acidobacteriota bacterium]